MDEGGDDDKPCDNGALPPSGEEGHHEGAVAKTTPPAPRWVWWIVFAGEAALCVLAAVAVGACLWMAPQRIGYPFDIDWCEGALVDTARRLLSGLPFYAPPSLDFTSYAYTPLYLYCCAAVFRLFGVGLPEARYVAFLFFLGTCAMTYLFVRRETGRRVWGFIAVGLFAAMFEKTFGWFDLVRVDFPFLFFLLAALHLVRFGKRAWSCGVAVGLLLFLSYFSKQTALLISVPVLACLALADWRRALAAGATLLLLVVSSTLLLEHATGGWYSYYTVDSLRQQGRIPGMWIGYWRDDLLGALPIPIVFSALALVAFTVRRRPGWFFYPMVLPGILLISWASRLHEGSSVNSSLPSYLMLVILCTVAAHGAAQFLSQRRHRAAACLGGAVHVLLILQFTLLAYVPGQFVPVKANLDAGWKLVNMMRELDGEVFMPHHGFMPALAGKRCHAHYVSSWDLLRGKNDALKGAWRRELEEAFRNGRFSVVVLDYGDFYYAPMAPYYDMFLLHSTLLPNWRNGEWGVTPAAIFVHRRARHDLEVVRRYFPSARQKRPE